MAKKHICRNKTVKVDGYVANRDGKIVAVQDYKRCPPKK